MPWVQASKNVSTICYPHRAPASPAPSPLISLVKLNFYILIRYVFHYHTPMPDTSELTVSLPASHGGLKLTPMLEQYLSIKEQHKAPLLFYRMGDFYELFFEDAEIASRELQIALTSRTPNAEHKVPMCGVPYHAVRGYINQLLDKGYSVAICEQVEDPREAKGLVKREVRIVETPGMAVEDDNLPAKGHSFLGALYWNEQSQSGGFAWLDFSTGDWAGLLSGKENELWQWVLKMAPRELLLPDSAKPPNGLEFSNTQVVRLPARSGFELKSAEERILKAQGVQELAALNLDKKTELVQACGALLYYAAQTQMQDITHLTQFKLLQLSRHLVLDEISERNLELFRRLDGRKGPGTLWHVLDKTQTPMGGRLLEERLRHPWRDLEAIAATQDVVGCFLDHEDRHKAITAALHDIYDLERLSTRIFLNRCLPKDFIALRAALQKLPELRRAMAKLDCPASAYATQDEASGQSLPRALHAVLETWDNLDEYHSLLCRALVDSPPPTITEGGLFKPGFTPELDELIDLTEHGEERINELLAREQAACGLPRLRLGFNKVFGHYFELSRAAMQGEPPPHFIRRQTLANAERFTTEELKELEGRLLSAEDRRKRLEYALFQNLRETIAAARTRMLFMAEAVAAVDLWQSLAAVARAWNWTRPKMHDGLDITIVQGRHPVVEAVQGSLRFIPNDLRLDDQRRVLLITGPNMAGKSTVLRQAAIICLLAQMGSYVPAKDASLGLCDRIFCRVGASDNLAQGQSTFMVEMMETARILRQATKKSLVILDEIGRGTSTFDGLSLAWAVAEDLTRKGEGGIRTLFATHYHELTALEGKLPGLHNMNVLVTESNGEMVFTRRLVPGPTDRSYGIEVARLAGVPQNVVTRAKRILFELESRARQNSQASPVKLAVENMPSLPGFEQALERPSATESAPACEPPHPLLVSLRDLDPEQLSPLEALKTLMEWKHIWGGKS